MCHDAVTEKRAEALNTEVLTFSLVIVRETAELGVTQGSFLFLLAHFYKTQERTGGAV